MNANRSDPDRIPILVKLLDKNFVSGLRMDGTLNESSFAQEYEAVWLQATDDARKL